MGRQGDVAIGSVVLGTMVLAVFGQTAGHPFVTFDDPSYITHNPVVLKGLTREGLRWAFGISVGNWHPLTWFSHMLDVELFGLHAGAHHAVSVLIHAASTVLLFALTKSLTGMFWRSLLVAALFGIHPLRVESVAWASERKDVLASFLWLLTAAAWIGYLRQPGRLRFLGAWGAYALGVCAKPMVMTLPAVLLLLDWWPLGRFPGPLPGAARRGSRLPVLKLLLEKTPFLLLAAASLVMTFVAQTRDAMIFVTPGLATRLANAFVSYAVYLGKFVWPSGLAVLYPYPVSGIPLWQSLAAGCLLAAVTTAVLMASRRLPYLPVGWFWYLVTLVPVIGLVQVGAQARADRYTYLPLVGVALAVVWLLGDAAPRNPGGRTMLAAVATAAVLLLAGAAFRQTSRWRDGITLYRHTLAVTGDNPLILYNLGTDYKSRGLAREAVAAYREVLRIDPGHADACNNLGDIRFKAGRYAEAAELFGRASGIAPSNTMYRFNLGMALARQGHKGRALEQWRLLKDVDVERARRLYREITS